MLRRLHFVLLCSAVLAACLQAEPPPAPPVVASRAELGSAAYQKACARCHELGVDGAPVTGRAADWAQRSRLWQAVLAEHARRGYLGMPAQAGGELSDQEVQAAAEHMLAITHPGLPPD